MSLLGERIITRPDWFPGKKGRTNMDSLAIYGGKFSVLPLNTRTVESANMAAIKIQQGRSNPTIFVKFMADLETKMASKVSYGHTYNIFTSRRLFVEISNLAGQNYIE